MGDGTNASPLYFAIRIGHLGRFPHVPRSPLSGECLSVFRPLRPRKPLLKGITFSLAPARSPAPMQMCSKLITRVVDPPAECPYPVGKEALHRTESRRVSVLIGESLSRGKIRVLPERTRKGIIGKAKHSDNKRRYKEWDPPAPRNLSAQGSVLGRS